MKEIDWSNIDLDENEEKISTRYFFVSDEKHFQILKKINIDELRFDLVFESNNKFSEKEKQFLLRQFLKETYIKKSFF